MREMSKSVLFGVLVAGAVVLVAGCSTPGPKAKAETGGEQVVMCSKCQMVWVRRSHTVGKATVYRKELVMECPDCKSAVANFFTTGKWQHTCAACGENLSECAMCK